MTRLSERNPIVPTQAAVSTPDGPVVELDLGGVHFEGFEDGFARRASSALEQSLGRALEQGSFAETLASATAVEMSEIVLEELDFSTPERLGECLADAILREVLR